MHGIGIVCYKIFNAGGKNNIGDWYQTAASLYMWWKYFKCTNTFSDFLKECVETQMINTYPIIWLYRDHLSECDSRGMKLITICNGWWLCENNRVFDFPPPPCIIPIYTSFHLADTRLLTEKNIEHFKLHQPIGCRDISTQEYMSAAGIATFFSGCMTMCLNLRDPFLGFHTTINYADTHVFVDAPIRTAPDDKHMISFVTQEGHYDKDPKWIAYSVQHVYNLLSAHYVTTSRLHIWLPLISNNASVTLINGSKTPYRVEDVDFITPKHDRFRGLVSLSAEQRYTVKKQQTSDCFERIGAILSEEPSKEGHKERPPEHPIATFGICGPFAINLSHRVDRWDRIQKSAKDVGLEIVRIEAVYDKHDGASGCLASHIQALETGKGGNAVWICEDDCVFIVDKQTIDTYVTKFMESDADVLCLGFADRKNMSYSTDFIRTYDCQAVSSYIVKEKVRVKLIELWKSVLECRKTRTIHPLESVYKSLKILNPEFLRRDQSWKIMQQEHVFLIPRIRCAIQGESHSDIVHEVVNYKC